MLDHISLQVQDYRRSKQFYAQALTPLGYELVMEFSDTGGFGKDAKPDFWIAQGAATKPALHIAFASPDRATVDAFHRVALAAGGKDNGAPGLRPEYHPNYYAAFVLDPDGNNIEAVCHQG
jgi:catechol 2,3-dioxygenase-like lactoylglutathione lyase family enzyme